MMGLTGRHIAICCSLKLNHTVPPLSLCKQEGRKEREGLFTRSYVRLSETVQSIAKSNCRAVPLSAPSNEGLQV
jgi:hypothetical protein